jgi:hypothetical protein
MQKDEILRTCRKYGGEEDYMRGLEGKTIWENPGGVKRIILKWILLK